MNNLTSTDQVVLIPTNGVSITEVQYPHGFQVAFYDAEGFVTAPRWFSTIGKAKEYARQLSQL